MSGEYGSAEIGGLGYGLAASGSSAAATTPILPTLQLVFSPTTGPWVTPAWIDITADIRARTPIRVRHGRDHVLDEFTAGTMTLELDNRDRHYDPLYTTGPYFGNLGPNKQVQLRATYNGITYNLFTGVVDGWEQDYDRSDRDATVRLSCTDMFRLLARRDFRPRLGFTLDLTDGTGRLDNSVLLNDDRPEYTRRRSGQRVQQICDIIGIDPAQQDIDIGAGTLQGGIPDDPDMLAFLQRIARTEFGRLFADTSGRLAFYDRHRARTDTTQATSQLTVGDTAAHTNRYHQIRFDPADERLIRNEARCGADGLEPRVRRNKSSIDTHGRQAEDRTGLLFVSEDEALDQAGYIVARYATAQPRIDQVTIKPRRVPATLWPATLGFEIGTQVTVERTPMDLGTAFSQPSHIEQVEHEIDLERRDWTTSWALTKADLTVYWKLDGGATTSRLDNSIPIGY